jgi:catechol 2,3-dioxygenase-like lactoylglutathione lyase family enzyme
MTTPKAYVEHVAVRVKDIQWHISFFKDVLGMTVRDVDGETDAPRQVWTLGGMQLMQDDSVQERPTNEAGRLAHIGVMCEDLEAALIAAKNWGVKELHQGRNWLQLPDGLAVELMQASPHAVQQALAVDPRAL